MDESVGGSLEHPTVQVENFFPYHSKLQYMRPEPLNMRPEELLCSFGIPGTDAFRSPDQIFIDRFLPDKF